MAWSWWRASRWRLAGTASGRFSWRNARWTATHSSPPPACRTKRAPTSRPGPGAHDGWARHRRARRRGPPAPARLGPVDTARTNGGPDGGLDEEVSEDGRAERRGRLRTEYAIHIP